MNPTAIFSKTGKGVQESSGKTSHLSRGDRAVLSAIDGKTTLGEVSKKFDKITGPRFDQLIQQLDKDGFIREVSAGTPQAAAPAARAPAPPPASSSGEEELDFTQALKLPPKAPAAGPPKTPPKAPAGDLAASAHAEVERKAKDQAFDYKARQEAEAKAKAEADAKAKAEAEARARAAAEAKSKAEAEARLRAEAEARAKADADVKVKAAREAAVRLAADAKAKAEAEAKVKTDAAEERARKEAEDKARLETELKAKLDEERKAREEAERSARDAADRARKEAEEKARRESEELRQRLEEERKAREEAERRAREEAERRAREDEERKRREEEDRRRKAEEERRAKEEAERKAREEEDRKRREEEDRKRREEEEARKRREAEDRERREKEERKRKEDDERHAKEERKRKDEEERRAKEEGDRRAREEDERRSREEAERKSKEEAAAKAPAPAAAAGGGIDDALLADLDSFTQREEEERKTREEADRKAKDEKKKRAKEAEEKARREEEEAKQREEDERRRKKEEERRAKEEEERREREEEEERRREEAARKRKAKESIAAHSAEEKVDYVVQVKEDDLDMDDVKRDEKALTEEARKTAREREENRKAVTAGVAAAPRKQVKWGKVAAIGLFVVLVGAVGLLQVMPVSTSEYEKAASEAFGVPVRIGSGRLSVLTGVEVKLERVAVGDAFKVALVRGFPDVGSIFGEKKSFSSIELEGITVSQDQLAGALLGKLQGSSLKVGRIVVKQAKLDGPLKLPALDADIVVGGDGALQSVQLRGPDKLAARLTPRGSEIAFEMSAGSMALPIAPPVTFSDFSMKGSATRQGMNVTEFDGRVFDGVVSGSSRIRWGASWAAEGEVRARALNIAVFAPTLISEGKLAEARGTYSMSGAEPSRLHESARIEGNFKIEKGVLGSFDLTRALQTGGSQATGRTLFGELNAQGVYDKGAVQLRNVTLSAGAMNAGASLDISAEGGLAGRIVADVKTPTQTLRATLNISGKLQEPIVRK